MKVMIEVNSPEECPYYNDDYNDDCRFPDGCIRECGRGIDFGYDCPLVALSIKQTNDSIKFVE